jgi:hypothetical protein
LGLGDFGYLGFMGWGLKVSRVRLFEIIFGLVIFPEVGMN